MTLHRSILVTAIVFSLALTGCVSKTTDATQFSGFLSDYSKLQEEVSPSGAPVLRYISPKLSDYKGASVILEKPVFYPAAQPSEQVSQQTLTDITNYLNQVANTQVGSVVKLTNQRKAGAVQLRTAITGVEVHTDKMKFYEVVPIAAVIAVATTASGHRDRYVEVYLEAEVSDAVTGEVLLQTVRKLLPEQQLENSSEQLTLKMVQPSLDALASDAKAGMKTYIAK